MISAEIEQISRRFCPQHIFCLQSFIKFFQQKFYTDFAQILLISAEQIFEKPHVADFLYRSCANIMQSLFPKHALLMHKSYNRLLTD